MSSLPIRVRSGVPNGGQFAASARTEPSVSLLSAPATALPVRPTPSRLPRPVEAAALNPASAQRLRGAASFFSRTSS